MEISVKFAILLDLCFINVLRKFSPDECIYTVSVSSDSFFLRRQEWKDSH